MRPGRSWPRPWSMDQPCVSAGAITRSPADAADGGAGRGSDVAPAGAADAGQAVTRGMDRGDDNDPYPPGKNGHALSDQTSRTIGPDKVGRMSGPCPPVTWQRDTITPGRDLTRFRPPGENTSNYNHILKEGLIMPRFDKTGPNGQGPMTGWQQGRCTSNQPATTTDQADNVAPAPVFGAGRGMGAGRGAGMGRGMGQGRGRRCLPGGGRGMGFGPGPVVAATDPAVEEELAELRAKVAQLEADKKK